MRLLVLFVMAPTWSGCLLLPHTDDRPTTWLQTTDEGFPFAAGEIPVETRYVFVNGASFSHSIFVRHANESIRQAILHVDGMPPGEEFPFIFTETGTFIVSDPDLARHDERWRMGLTVVRAHGQPDGGG